jgi:hypothetical protein
MWWFAVPGHVSMPFDRSYLLPGISDFFAATTWYMAGLYAGSSRGRYVTRAIGIVLALVGSGVAMFASSFWIAIVASTLFTALLAAAAYSNFVSGSDFDGQPVWGRAANVAAAFAAVLMMVFAGTGIASAFRGQVIQPQAATTSAVVTGGGEIVLARGDRATDLSGKPRPELDFILGARRIDHNVIMSVPIATDERTAHSAMGNTFRITDRWVSQLAPQGEGDVPLRFYDGRLGLISLYDETSRRLVGWVGPEGLTMGATMPAARFAGTLQMPTGGRQRLLVLTSGVYRFDRQGNPKLLFGAPAGETILQASDGRMLGGAEPRRDSSSWGWFTAITTNARTYVVNGSGHVEVSLAHPQTKSPRMVRVFRASYAPPAAATFLWYAASGIGDDTLSEVFEFRKGSAAAVAEHRFNAPAFSTLGGDESGTVSETVSVHGSFGYVPALELYVAGRSPDRAAVRAALISVVVCLVLAGFTLWLSRRFAFSRERTATWTALTALAGPATLAVMWMFLERPTPRS